MIRESTEYVVHAPVHYLVMERTAKSEELDGRERASSAEV